MIIDDNHIDIFIAEKMIEATVESCEIFSFKTAKEALTFINEKEVSQTKTIMFVDINMPLVDGFKFMEDFEKLPEEKLKMHLPCFLTSSINEGDISYAKNFKTIKQYINKPLSQKLIQNLISTLE